MSKNYCNCPNFQTENCPAGEHDERLRAELEAAKRDKDHWRDKFEAAKADNARLAAALWSVCDHYHGTGAANLAAAGLKTSTALRDLLGPTVAWIERFPCPECDGSGCKYDGNGNPCQCQFCFERQQELARLRAVMGEKV